MIDLINNPKIINFKDRKFKDGRVVLEKVFHFYFQQGEGEYLSFFPAAFQMFSINKTIADTQLIAYCGVYCRVCKRYLNGECQGCLEIDNSLWCQVRICCIEHNYSTCADCRITEGITNCKKLIETSSANVLCMEFEQHAVIWGMNKTQKS